MNTDIILLIPQKVYNPYLGLHSCNVVETGFKSRESRLEAFLLVTLLQ